MPIYSNTPVCVKSEECEERFDCQSSRPFRVHWDRAPQGRMTPEVWAALREEAGLPRHSAATLARAGAERWGVPAEGRAGVGLSPEQKSPFPKDCASYPGRRQKWRPTATQLPSICGVRYAVNANLARVFVPTVESKCPGVPVQLRDAVRGEIGPFSAESRRRLLDRLNSIDREAIPSENVWFTTLTYPGSGWPSEFTVWKRQLETWWKRFQRQYLEEYGVQVGPDFVAATLIWKLEYQRRGAPHYHLLLIWLDRSPNIAEFREWLARSWAEVVAGRGNEVDPDHLAAGTQCDRAEKWGGVSAYAAKYCSKQTQQLIDRETGEIYKNGRWWGCKALRALPVQMKSEALTEAQSVMMRRVLQKKSIREAVTGGAPNWKVIKFRKNRRGWKMGDESFYVLSQTMEALIPLVRCIRPENYVPPDGRRGPRRAPPDCRATRVAFDDLSSSELVVSLRDGDAPWEVVG